MRGRRGVVALGAVAGFLCACDSSVQRQRLATCRRAVPAIVASDGTARVLRIGSGSTPDSVRVDYSAGSRQHWVVCRFDSGAGLVGVAADGAALTGASLYLLKHYYLDAPESGGVEPVER